MASFAKSVRSCAELCQLWQRVTMGSYDHVEDLYKFWKHIGAVCQLWQALASLARAPRGAHQSSPK